MLRRWENNHKFFKLEPTGFIVYKAILLVIPLFIFTMDAWADVQIKNDQSYTEDGITHIVGEIQNNLGVPLNQISIIGKIYDSSNNVIGIKTVNPLTGTIMPDMKAPFEMILSDGESKNMIHYSLEADYNIGTVKNQVIDIIDSKINQDSYNNVFITGMVANRGDVTANIISVIATTYDKYGNVATVSETHPEPDYLRTNDEAFFIIPIHDKKQSESIVDYTLIAESDEYVAVPEFPIGSMVLLVISIVSYIVITRYSGKIITNLVCASDPR